MQSQISSPSTNLTTLSDIILMGAHSVPLGIYRLRLRPVDFRTIIALLSFEHDFLWKSNGQLEQRWFYVKTEDLGHRAVCSERSLKRALPRLKFLGLIDYRKGNGIQKRATEYRILLDSFYLADLGMEEHDKEQEH